MLRALYSALSDVTEIVDLGFKAASSVAVGLEMSDAAAVAMGIPAIGLDASLRSFRLDLQGARDAPCLGAPLPAAGRPAGVVVASSQPTQQGGEAVVIASLDARARDESERTIQLVESEFPLTDHSNSPVTS